LGFLPLPEPALASSGAAARWTVRSACTRV
jgi:hypothetical protein